MELDKYEFDWRLVVEKQPKGYVELNNGEQVIHGPVESVQVDELADMVIIKAKWAAKVSLGPLGVPNGKWKPLSNEVCVIAQFPNLMFPFLFEDTPEKGLRVRCGLNIIYLNPVEGLDPSRVEGLHPAV